MAEYVCHERSLVSKSRKPKVSTPSASNPSVTHSELPTVVSQVATPSLSSIADDDKIKNYVHSFLASMLSQPSGQISLGSNPFFSAPSVEVPDIPSCGSTGGRSAESLSSWSASSPSSVVPPSSQDVVPPIHVSVSNVVSVDLAGVSGSPSPSLGVSAPVLGRSDQLRVRGDVGLTQHVVSADIHSVPRSVSSFDPTALFFPFSDSGFFSLSALAPPLPSFSSSVSSSFSVVSAPFLATPSTVPLFSLPSVVPSVLSAPLPLSPSFPPGPPPGFSSSSVSSFSSSLPPSSASSFLPWPSSASSSSSSAWPSLSLLLLHLLCLPLLCFLRSPLLLPLLLWILRPIRRFWVFRKSIRR